MLNLKRKRLCRSLRQGKNNINIQKTSVVLTIKWRTFYFIKRITKRILHELNIPCFSLIRVIRI
jgi:hypothetical protein